MVEAGDTAELEVQIPSAADMARKLVGNGMAVDVGRAGRIDAALAAEEAARCCLRAQGPGQRLLGEGAAGMLADGQGSAYAVMATDRYVQEGSHCSTASNAAEVCA